jgi:hypothetical protein
MKATNGNESAAKSQGSLYTQPTNGVGSSLAGLDVPSLISQILGQYQGSLVHQVEQAEKELKSKALAAVKDQSRVFHLQAKERLGSVELDVQQRFQAVLQEAEDGIFTVIHEEMGAVFSELEASFESLLHDKPGESESTACVPIPQGEQETTVEPDRNGYWRQQVTGHVIAEAPEPLPETKSAPAPELAWPNQNVRLELPPLSQKSWLNRFQERYTQIEELAASRGLIFDLLPLEQKDSLWKEVKQLEVGWY